MHKRCPPLPISALLALPAALFAPGVLAGGFALDDLAAGGLGGAYAGAAAAKGEVGAAFHNPAALAGVHSRQIAVGGNLVGIKAKFKAERSETWLVDRATGATGSTSLLTGTPTGQLLDVGGGGDDVSDRGVVPSFFYAQPVAGQFTFGVGVHAPFGTSTKFDPNWAGRYTAIDTVMTGLMVSPTVAWQANANWSFGLSLNAVHIDAEVSKALDFHYEALIAELATGGPVPVLDGKATLKGKGWGYGAKLGALYQADNGARFGVSFRTTATPKVKGDYKVEIPALYSQIAAAIGQRLDSEVQSAKADVKLPWRLAVAGDWPLNPEWSLQADVTVTGWDRFDELRARINNTPDQVQVQNWRNTTRIGVGATWRQTDALTLKFGIAHEQSPVRSAQWRHPSTPESDRLWFAAGATWTPQKGSRLDLFAAYARMKNGDVDYTDTAVNRADYPFFAADQKFRVKGSFDLGMWALGIQYAHAF